MSKIIIYTVIMGGYDSLPVVTLNDEIEYYCYTDYIPENTNGWTCVYLAPIFKDNKLNVGYLKANPHLIFPWNAIVVWIDSNVESLELSRAQIYAMLEGHSIAALPHPHRHFFYGESAVVADYSLDNRNKIAKWEQELKSMEFPDNDNLAELGFLIRDLRDSNVRRFNKTWWSFILEGSRRDQLSFTPALWYHNLKWKAIKTVNIPPTTSVFFTPIFKEHLNPLKRVIPNKIPSFIVSDFSPFCWTELIDSKDKSGKNRNHYLHHEYWTEELLENIRSLNEIVQEQGGSIKENYFYIEKKNIGKHSIPDIRHAWKREYLKKAILPSRWGIEIGFRQGHSTALMLGCNPNLSIIAIESAPDQITFACAQKLSSIYNTRLEVYYDKPAKAITVLSGKLSFEKLEFIHYNSPDVFDAEEFQEFMEWYLCTSSIGCRIIISDMITEISFVMNKLYSLSILNQVNPGVPNISENRQYIKFSHMDSASFRELFSSKYYANDTIHEMEIIQDRNTTLQKINDELIREKISIEKKLKGKENLLLYFVHKVKPILRKFLKLQ
ncbi:MAG TPA: hypothetical protein VNW06_01690 [Cytophagaceae bacterium]|jgi:hypothetical protein|nr:hypothetical protein [Cytophagaceae bacterium]